MNEHQGEPATAAAGLTWDDGSPPHIAAPPDARQAVADEGEPGRGALGPAPWGLAEVAWVIFATLALLVAVFTALSFAVERLGIDSDGTADARGTAVLLLAQLLLDIGAVAIAAGFSLAKFRISAADGWDLRRPPRIRFGLCAAVLGASYAALVIYGLVVAALGLSALEPANNVPTALFEYPTVLPLTLLLILVAAPLFEEMFFRGFLFSGFWSGFSRLWVGLRLSPGFRGRWQAWGAWPAIVLSGFLFSLIHAEVGLIIPITIIGALFAWLRVRTGSLWNPILVHFGFNLIGATASVVNAYG